MLIVIDSEENKTDSTNVYAGLNNLKDYREAEFKWLENPVETDMSFKGAPFRILFMLDPMPGCVDEKNKAWTQLANKERLIIGRHWYRFKKLNLGESDGNKYPILILG